MTYQLSNATKEKIIMLHLEAILTNKSIKQVKAMMTKRKEKEAKAQAVIDQYDSWIYKENKEAQKKVKSAEKKIDDCQEWLEAAVYCFGRELWNDMVGDVYGYLDSYGFDELLDGTEYLEKMS